MMPERPLVESTRWLVKLKPRSQARLHLICFPYAGGGVPAYRNWAEDLPAEAEIQVALLPGRGSRFREAPLKQLDQVVEPLSNAIQRATDLPIVFYGHSLGALLGFEVARQMRRLGAPMPAGLFLSGREAPHWQGKRPAIHALPDSDFLQELKRINGTPADVLENGELMQLLMPVLRADFAIAEQYGYHDEAPLECPIKVFGGLDDILVMKDGLEAWREHTCAEFSLLMLPGDHFFIYNQRERFLQALAEDLRNIFDWL